MEIPSDNGVFEKGSPIRTIIKTEATGSEPPKLTQAETPKEIPEVFFSGYYYSDNDTSYIDSILGTDEMINCKVCSKWVHHKFIVNSPKLLVLGDPFVLFECKNCSPTGLETYDRVALSWTATVASALYHLVAKQRLEKANNINSPFDLFVPFKAITNLLDEYWEIFGVGRTKTITWQNTVASVLSTCKLFLSGTEKFKRPGFWSVKDTTTPEVIKKANGYKKSSSKNKLNVTGQSPNDTTGSTTNTISQSRKPKTSKFSNTINQDEVNKSNPYMNKTNGEEKATLVQGRLVIKERVIEKRPANRTIHSTNRSLKKRSKKGPGLVHRDLPKESVPLMSIWELPPGYNLESKGCGRIARNYYQQTNPQLINFTDKDAPLSSPTQSQTSDSYSHLLSQAELTHHVESLPERNPTLDPVPPELEHSSDLDHHSPSNSFSDSKVILSSAGIPELSNSLVLPNSMRDPLVLSPSESVSFQILLNKITPNSDKLNGLPGNAPPVVHEELLNQEIYELSTEPMSISSENSKKARTRKRHDTNVETNPIPVPVHKRNRIGTNGTKPSGSPHYRASTANETENNYSEKNHSNTVNTFDVLRRNLTKRLTQALNIEKVHLPEKRIVPMNYDQELKLYQLVQTIPTSSPLERRLLRRLELKKRKEALKIPTFNIDQRVQEYILKKNRDEYLNSRVPYKDIDDESTDEDPLIVGMQEFEEVLEDPDYPKTPLEHQPPSTEASKLGSLCPTTPQEDLKIEVTAWENSFASRLYGNISEDKFLAPQLQGRISSYHGITLKTLLWRIDSLPLSRWPIKILLNESITKSKLKTGGDMANERSRQHSLLVKDVGSDERESKTDLSSAETRLPFPFDFCYLDSSQLPQVNQLLSQLFWDGIDMTEALQYPEYSVVVTYRYLVVGCAFMTPGHYITYFAVVPGWQRCGIGKYMLYLLIQAARGRDVTLHTSPKNPALILYQKFGFKAEQFIVNFYDKYLIPTDLFDRNALFLRLRG